MNWKMLVIKGMEVKSECYMHHTLLPQQSSISPPPPHTFFFSKYPIVHLLIQNSNSMIKSLGK